MVFNLAREQLKRFLYWRCWHTDFDFTAHQMFSFTRNVFFHRALFEQTDRTLAYV